MGATRAWWTGAEAVAMALVATLAWAQGEVRPLQPRAARLLQDGMRRSRTLRTLVAEIRQSDAIVYLDLDPADPSPLEGSLRFKAATAGARYLRVWLQPRRCDETLLAMLGHELQHAVEVARAAAVRSEAAFAAHFAAFGRSRLPGKYETDTAQEMGARVRDELAATR